VNPPFPLRTPAFVAAVQAYLHEHLSDWAEDFADLEDALETMWREIDEEGAPDASGIEVYREELRPSQQVAERSYGSLGACWTWDLNCAATCHHDNAYDSHGRDVEAIIFVATVPLKDVDWVQTMAKNLVLKNEREINIKDGTKLTVDGQMKPRTYRYEVGGGFQVDIENMSDF
jgi:hypothetical protein